MHRRTAEIALIAGILVLVISVSASTLDSTTSSSDNIGFGGDNGTGFTPQPSVNVSADGSGASLPSEPLMVIAAIGALISVWYLLTNPRDAIALMVGAAVMFGVMFLILYFLQDLFGGSPGGNGGGFLGGGGGSSDSGSGSALLEPESFELIVVVVLGAAFVGVLLRATGSIQAEAVGEQSPESTAVDVDAIARTAGRAADRIEADAALDNEVYRAWQEMTDLLDVPDPETSTPREFAAAAVTAGMDREDVHELTVLFEEVRYGAEDPTSEREERAVAALRRIESYAHEDKED